MAGIETPVHFLFNDYSNEKTRVMLHIDPVADDGSNWADLFVGGSCQEKELADDLAILSLCNLWTVTAPIQVAVGSKTTPSDEAAQREIIIVWTYKDTVTGLLYRFDTPGPVDGLTKPNSDEIDMTDALVAAFKIAFDANCYSPQGNAASLLRGQKTGKRS